MAVSDTDLGKILSRINACFQQYANRKDKAAGRLWRAESNRTSSEIPGRFYAAVLQRKDAGEIGGAAICGLNGQKFGAAPVTGFPVGGRAEPGHIRQPRADCLYGRRIALADTHAEVEAAGLCQGAEKRQKIRLGSVFRAAVRRDQNDFQGACRAAVSRLRQRGEQSHHPDT